MYYTVYKTTNVVNGNFYVGVHKTSDLEDGYLGSGLALRRAIDKYGEQHFSKEIIHFGKTEDECYELEELIVDKNFISRKDTYNIALGGNGGDLGESVAEKIREHWKELPEDVKQRRRLSLSLSYNKTEEVVNRRADSLRKFWKQISYSERKEHGKKISDGHLSRSQQKKKITADKRAEYWSSVEGTHQKSRLTDRTSNIFGDRHPNTKYSDSILNKLYFSAYYYKTIDAVVEEFNLQLKVARNFLNGIERRKTLHSWLDSQGLSQQEFTDVLKKYGIIHTVAPKLSDVDYFNLLDDAITMSYKELHQKYSISVVQISRSVNGKCNRHLFDSYLDLRGYSEKQYKELRNK